MTEPYVFNCTPCGKPHAGECPPRQDLFGTPNRQALTGATIGGGSKSMIESIQALVKALEACSYNAAPGTLHQCRRDGRCGVVGCDPSIAVDRPRFTAAQEMFFRSGISFVHLAATERRRLDAEAWFKHAVRDLKGVEGGNGYRYRLGDVRASFILCRLMGASSEHVPVMFVDGTDEEFAPHKRALDEARFIPACVKGVGPMTIR